VSNLHTAGLAIICKPYSSRGSVVKVFDLVQIPHAHNFNNFIFMCWDGRQASG